jgi:hypothetical protein
VSRPRALDYAGAAGVLRLEQLAALDARRFAVQPKIDGVYVRLHLDAGGRIARGYSSTGELFDLGDLVGVLAGEPHAQLVGELEAHTEAGIRAALIRGYACAHLHDVIHDGRRYIARAPYRARRDALQRMVVAVELAAGDDRPWVADDQGAAHDPRTGRYQPAIPRAWRRVPVIPQLPLAAASQLWGRAVAGELEGMVVVALDAPLGARAAKRKIKPTDTLDAVAVAVDAAAVVCRWAGGTFTVGRGCHQVAAGDVVEVRHQGYYEAGAVPRFARLERVRADLR